MISTLLPPMRLQVKFLELQRSLSSSVAGTASAMSFTPTNETHTEDLVELTTPTRPPPLNQNM